MSAPTILVTAAKTPPPDQIRAGLLDAVTLIWADVLQVEAVEENEKFSDLDGDSIAAGRILARVFRDLGHRVRFDEFFLHPTPGRLADLLAERDAIAVAAPAVQRPRPAVLPATPSQKRLWFLDKFIPDRQAYNVYRLVRLNGPVDPQQLALAWSAVVERHEALRSWLNDLGGEASLVVESFIAAGLEQRPVPNGNAEAVTREIRRQTVELASTPIDLAKPPLWRILFWRVSDREAWLAVVIHSVVADGWSIGRLFADLAAEYRRASGEAVGFPAPVAQFADYAVAESVRPVDDGDLAYWRKRLAGRPQPLELPFSNPRPKAQTFAGDVVRFAVPKERLVRLDRLAAGLGATRAHWLLAVFQALIHRLTRQDDLWLGMPVANRHTPDEEATLGFFVNTLVLRTDLGGDPTFRELVGRVRETCVGAIAHGRVSLETLIEELRPPRDTARQPFFQVLFQYQNVPMRPKPIGHASARLEPIHNGSALFDLRLVVEDEDDGSVSAWFEFNTDLLDREPVERMAGHYRTLLDASLEHSDRPFGGLPILPAAEFKAIVYGFNPEPEVYPYAQLIHEAFEATANKQPDAVALITADGENWTYGRLEAEANRVARWLERRNVKPGEFVGICA